MIAVTGQPTQGSSTTQAGPVALAGREYPQL
jgi:hypothetical protein